MKRFSLFFLISLFSLTCWIPHFVEAQDKGPDEVEDTTAPTATIYKPLGRQNGPFDVQIVFSEAVLDFVQSDLSLADSTATASITAWTPTDDITYTATITPTTNGEIRFKVPAGVATDAAGNPNTFTFSARTRVLVFLDSTTVSVTMPSGEQTGAFDATITFSRAVVSGFATSKLSLTGTAEALITGWNTTDNITYTVEITPTSSGTVGLRVPAEMIVDVLNKRNVASETQTVTVNIDAESVTDPPVVDPVVEVETPVDVEAPGVSISGLPSDVANSAFDVTITFTEKITFSTTNGDPRASLSFVTNTAGATIGSGYTMGNDGTGSYVILQITPTRSGEITLIVPAGVATDAASNPNTASQTQTVTVNMNTTDVSDPVVEVETPVDIEAPGVSISGLPLDISGLPLDVANSAFDVSITFTEAVSDFLQSDVSLTGTATASITAWNTTDNTTYTATITPTTSGTVILSIAAGVAIDAASNPNTASETHTIVVDVDAPRVSVSVPSGVQNGQFRVSLTFTEAISLSQDPLELTTNTAGATIDPAWITSADQTTYTTRITPTSSGEVVLGVPADVGTDAAGNPNTASQTQTVTIDMDAPSVSVSGFPSGIQNGAFDATITFTERVSGLEQTDLSLSGTATASITAWNKTDDTTYTATITPTTSGDVTLNIAAGVTTDAASNNNTASTPQTAYVDVDVPSVSISGFPSDVQNGAFDATITFTERVSRFQQWDVSLSGTATASITAWHTTDFITYTATITPTTSGTVIIDVPADIATDAGNNSNTAAVAQTVTVDIDTPSVSVSAPSGVQRGAFDATITFSEAVSNFEQADVSLSGTATATITAWNTTDDTTFTATITPTTSGTVIIDVPADVATDTGDNGNTAAVAQTVTVDIDAPSVSVSVPSGVQRGAFDATITFTEAVSNFEQADVSLTGTATATITAWQTTDDTTYTATITPTTSGDVTISVAAGVATDAANNNNTAATAQTATIQLVNLLSGRTQQVQDAIVAAVPEADSAYDVTEAHLADITELLLSNQGITALKAGDFNGLIALEVLSLSRNHLSRLPADVFDGLTALAKLEMHTNPLTALPAGIFDDLTALTTLNLDENDLTTLPAGILDTLTALTKFDMGSSELTALPPGIFKNLTKLSQLYLDENQFSALPDGIFENLTALTIIIINRNPVDPLPLIVSLEKVEEGQFKAIAPSGVPFELVLPLSIINGSIDSGVNSITIPSGGVESGVLTVTRTAGTTADITVDLGTLPGRPSIPVSLGYGLVKSDDLPLVVIETIPVLSVSVTVPSVPQNSAFDATITFTEAVSNFEQADVSLTGTATATITAWNTTDDTTFTATITPTTSGTVIIDVPADVATDTGDNGNTAAVAQTVTVDIDAPSVSVSVPSGVQSGAFDATITFSEVVSNFEQVDVSLTGTATATITAWQTTDDTTYTAEITPTTSGDVTISVAAGVATDAANNNNTAATAQTATIQMVNLLSGRTQQVQDAILAAVPEADSAYDVTEAHLADITELLLINQGITALKAGDFNGLIALETLNLSDNDLSRLPADVFDGLTALAKLEMHTNPLTALPAGIFDDLTALTTLNLDENDLSALPAGILDTLTALTRFDMGSSELTALPPGIFKNLTKLSQLYLDENQFSALPDGIFENLTALTIIIINRNPVDPLPLIVSLEKVEKGQFKAIAPSGVPFELVLPLSIINGSIDSGVNSITIPSGGVESGVLTVTRTAGTTADVTVDLGTLPGRPSIPVSLGYGLVKSDDLPLIAIEAISLLSGRTQQVQDAIVAAVPEADSAYDVTEAHLADITELLLINQGITALKSGDFDGLTALTTLYLYNNELSTLPTGIFDELTALKTLYLSNNELSALPENIFDELTALTTLYLDTNQLSTLPAGLFENLTALTMLNLNTNELSVLPPGIFDELTALATLYLNTNELSVLPQDIFDELAALTTLDLNTNQLSSLPAGIFEYLTAMISLNLNANKLSVLPQGIFDNLTALTRLYLNGNELSSLPANVFDGLTALTNVYLSDNSVDSLPLTVSLEKVEEGEIKAIAPTGAPFALVLPLSVTNGSLSGGATSITIPTGSVESQLLTVIRTAGTTAAVTVDIGDPLPELPTGSHSGYGLVKSDDLPLIAIEAIPVLSGRTQQVQDAIVAAVSGVNTAYDVTEAHLADITTLQLPLKNITALKSGDFDGLTALTFLYLNGNDLSSLPADVFDGLTALELLYLDGNELSSLPADVFDGLTALTTLRLDGNNLSSLPADVFDGLTALELLYLYDNELSSLPANVFDGLTALTTLSLRRNDLSSLQGDVFDELTALTLLNLSDNELSSLPANVFDGLTALTSVYLSDNSVDSLPLTVSLEKVEEGEIKAIAPTGAPFALVLPLSVTNGSLSGGATSITIPTGSVESQLLTVTRTAGTTAAVTVDIGDPLPEPPTGSHSGYGLVKSDDLPLVAIEAISLLSGRTQQVQDAIVAAVPDVDSADDVTEAHLAAITTLQIGGQGTTTLKSGDLDGLTGLTEFGLVNNPLGALPDDIFDNFTALTHLRLYTNQLSSLPAGIFDDLTALEWLDLGSNELTTLPDGIFDNLTALTHLHLNHNGLSAVPDDIFDNLTALTHFYLQGNDLTTLPDGIFENLTKLVWFNLQDNQLSALPDGIFESLTALGWLYLEDNSVDPLPLTVSLEKVGEAQVKATALTGAPFDIALLLSTTNGSLSDGTTTIRIPKGSVESDALTMTRTAGTFGDVTVDIGDPLPGPPSSHNGYTLVKSVDLPLVVIEDTSLIGNRTPQVRDAIVAAVPDVSVVGDITEAHLADITVLHLESNRITALKAGDFDGLTALTTLLLFNNDLSALPENIFDELTALTYLNLSTNALSALPTDIFDELTAMILLTLSDNALSALPTDIFDELTVLTHLDLSNNALSALPTDIFDELTALTYLNLSNNALSALPTDIFDDLTALTSLDLDTNALSALPTDIFDELTVLTHLYLNTNALSVLLPGIFENLTALTHLYLNDNALSALPAGIFENLTALTQLNLEGNSVDPLPLTVSLEKVGEGEVKATVPTAAPFNITLQLDIINTDLGGPHYIIISKGRVESDVLTVTRTAGSAEAVTVGIGDPLPQPPKKRHNGYTLVKSVDPPLVVIEDSSIIGSRTPQVRDAIVAEVPGANSTGDITEARLADITNLDLYNTGITVLKVGDFDGLTALTSLYVTNNELSALPAGLFDDLTALTQLELSGNALSAVPTGIFDNLTALTQIEMHSNQLSAVPTGIFDNLTELTQLNLSYNELSAVPTGIFDNLTELTQLRLSNNKLSAVPEGIFENLTALTYLSLNNNELSAVPEGIFENLTALTWLTLHENSVDPMPITVSLERVGEGEFKAIAPTGAPLNIRLPLSVTNGSISGGANSITIPRGSVESEVLTVIPDTTDAVTVNIGTLPKPSSGQGYKYVKSGTLPLTVIDLAYLIGSRTSQVQDAIVAAAGVNSAPDITEAHLAAITSLQLSDASITALNAGDFDDLTALTTLDLNTNELSALPAGIFDNLTALTTLKLNSNQLNTLPAGIFDNLTALTEINLGNNKLKKLRSGIFDNLITLTEINLQGNRLNALRSGIFDNLTALTEINLGSNKLNELPAGIFDNLTALKTLDLHDNSRLGTLPDDIFDNLTTLTELNLKNAVLSALPEDIFDNLTKLTTLNLFHNELSALPADAFENLTKLTTLDLRSNDLSALPAGIFENLTALTHLYLNWNTVDPLPVSVSLEKVGEDQVKATALTGAPFDLVLPLSTTNGGISGGATSVTISAGSVESTALTVTRTAGTTAAVTVNIGTLPGLPSNHYGYALVKSADLPLEVISSVQAAPALGVASLLDPATLKTLDPETLEAKLDTLLAESDGSLRYLQAIALLESVLAEMRPEETLLLANYPNPFNPETWIPYHLADTSDVQITIYNARGTVVRRLDIGHQLAGYYTSRSRAAHWDGRNDIGERIATGIYFYQLQAGNVSFLRKMVILK